MNKRLSFIPTAIIFILSFLLAGAFLIWLTTTFDLPDWVMTVGEIFIFLFVYEIPARIGPQPFETPLFSMNRLGWKDKSILIISLSLGLVFGILTGENKDSMPTLMRLLAAVLMLAIMVGPIWIFGSTEAKNLIFKKNRHDFSRVKENSE